MLPVLNKPKHSFANKIQVPKIKNQPREPTNGKWKERKKGKTYTVLTGASVDALDPERAHVTLLVAAISVGVLQCLLHSLSGYPYAVLGPAPEPLC